MHAQEFYYACEEFTNYGKVKDIDFSDELWYVSLNSEDHTLIIKAINFKEGVVELGKRIDFGCDCCGYYYDSTYYDLDELASEGYLGMILDRLGEVLNEKTGV